jgi:hypothetical protein
VRKAERAWFLSGGEESEALIRGLLANFSKILTDKFLIEKLQHFKKLTQSAASA